MDDLSPADLKTILHSRRANLYYLEHCRVLVNGGRVEYVTDEGRRSLYWNIPIANTTALLPCVCPQVCNQLILLLSIKI